MGLRKAQILTQLSLATGLTKIWAGCGLQSEHVYDYLRWPEWPAVSDDALHLSWGDIELLCTEAYMGALYQHFL